jgi:hypothetical protein
VQAPVLGGVGVGLVACVDDRPLEGGLQADLLLEEVRPLGELEGHVDAARGRRLAAHLARPAVQLAGDEVGHDVLHDPAERRLAVHQVVLVRPVGVALAVGVVLVDGDRLAGRQEAGGRVHRPDQDPLPRLVVADRLQGGGALGRRELGVGMVDVVPGAVGEDGVDQVRLHLGGGRAVTGEAAGVVSGRLVLEVPPDLA